jgi:pRiA4b ORF-3-like protein
LSLRRFDETNRSGAYRYPALVAPKPNTFTLRIALLDHQPEIWRRMLVPGSVRLDKLHLIFQEAMGWTNSHLHQFRIGHALYGMHYDDWPDEELHEVKFRFANVQQNDRFRYDYDFGDSWEHDVVVERAHTIRPVLQFPVCLDGANACPPEDCGGTGGYADLLEALADPSHPEHRQYRQYRQYRQWVGRIFDPAAFDLAAINAALQRLG